MKDGAGAILLMCARYLCQRQGKKGERERETERKEGREEEKKEGKEKGKKDRYLLKFPQLKNLYKILERPYTYMAPTRMGQKNVMFGCCCTYENCRITMQILKVRMETALCTKLGAKVSSGKQIRAPPGKARHNQCDPKPIFLKLFKDLSSLALSNTIATSHM